LVKIQHLVAEINQLLGKTINRHFRIKETLLGDNPNLVEVFKILQADLGNKIINLEDKKILIIKDQIHTNKKIVTVKYLINSEIQFRALL
jgi:transcription initiation factor IIE alpha subunit